MESYTIGDATALPGSTASGTLTVGDGSPGSSETIIPFTIVHGIAPGPVLALVAGTHGSEYVPIIALQRLASSIDPATLSGTILMVHVANMPSFLSRTVYYSPSDGQNLNRVFPGKPDGTLSERIADVITREIIARATHVADLHGGDGNESLRPYSYWITTGAEDVAEQSRAMALAFGLEYIIVDHNRPTDPARSSFLSNTAILHGKPAITTETGDRSRVDEDMVQLVEHGVAGLLKHLGMRDDGPPPVAAAHWIDREQVLRADATGLFYPAVVKGQMVEAGDVLGRITDFHGRLLESISAPFAGEILYIVDTPPITKGEPIGMVGTIAPPLPYPGTIP
jgi:predicted deacylase